MAQRRGSSPIPGEPLPRWTSGRECWVFRAETPDELCGYHARLIGSALARGETIQHLLYSPLFEASDGPFRVGGAPGSHAVALTTSRLLISRDPHSEREPRSVQSIDLGSVHSIEIGGALTLAWFVVRFSGRRRPAALPVLFSAHGLGHFRSIVRSYLGRSPSVPVPGPAALDWPGVLRETPAFLRSELAPLAQGTDPPLAVLRTAERWTGERRPCGAGAVCLSAVGLLAATPLGLLWAVSEARARPDRMSFGVNVTAVRADRVASACISSRAAHGTPVSVLRVRAGDSSAATDLEVPFDEPDLASAESIAHVASSWRGGR